jgi:hypothetical protein
MNLPNPVICLLNNVINKERYDENNLIDRSDCPAQITFEFKDGGYVDPSCAISRFLQGPKKLVVECCVRYDDPITGRMRFKNYRMDASGEWILK